MPADKTDRKAQGGFPWPSRARASQYQAQVLLPLVRALSPNLCEERAQPFVRKAIGRSIASLGDMGGTGARAISNSAGVTCSNGLPPGERLDYKVVPNGRQTRRRRRHRVSVRRCYQDLGEPDLRFPPHCSADFALAEWFTGATTRTPPVSPGADHCDFRFKLKRQRGTAT